ncbi:hypothetical protein [Fimbriimonas ginsengisoli]|uniref:hypothetical protein n=1 Tax=Fimbriimonas ginsengisoli TaxID=1005039 RepID=UPI00046CFF7E|nr:hypothetical protein [Fimbriimonas ginsengisoli]
MKDVFREIVESELGPLMSRLGMHEADASSNGIGESLTYESRSMWLIIAYDKRECYVGVTVRNLRPGLAERLASWFSSSDPDQPVAIEDMMVSDGLVGANEWGHSRANLREEVRFYADYIEKNLDRIFSKSRSRSEAG